MMDTFLSKIHKLSTVFFQRVGILIISPLIFIILFSICSTNKEPQISADKKREIANVLYNQQLYQQAISEYQDYLENYQLNAGEKANISYMIANIYYDRLHDYENALAYYLRIKHLFPESDLQSDINKKIVECLERLKRSTDAQQVIEQSAALDESQKPKSQPGEVVARIGSREITSGDLQYELNRLPVYLREQIQSKEQKIEFLKSYIVQELLYDSAKRMGLDKDKEVREGVLMAEKSIMSQKLLQQEIEKETGIDKYSNADVELYYKANKEKYAEKDEAGKIKSIPSFGEVQEKVAQDFIQEKQQEAYQRLIERLMKSENVQIYEKRFQ
jgi:TolA-binding protein